MKWKKPGISQYVHVSALCTIEANTGIQFDGPLH